MKVYWHDVVRVHLANPRWSTSDIAAYLGCCSGYVRATATRRKLPIPRMRRGKRFVRVLVPLADVLPLCRPKEPPHAALERIVDEAMKARAA